MYAGAEACKALRAGLHVMLFSDNVSVETEIELKRLARERGAALMGPDCGTAIIDGVPLGFANAVPRGRIGLAAASGTGLQEVTCRLAAEGEGVSHAIGVGGRDLSDAVGGAHDAAHALAALAADPATEVICVVGKPPGRRRRQAPRRGRWRARQAVRRPLRRGRRAPWHDRRRPAALARPPSRTPALAAVALARGAQRRAPSSSRCPPPRSSAWWTRAVQALRARASASCAACTRAARWRGRRSACSRAPAGVTPGVLRRRRRPPRGRSRRRRLHGRPAAPDDRRHRAPRVDRARGPPSPATAVLLLDVVLGYGAHRRSGRRARARARRPSRARSGAVAVVASVVRHRTATRRTVRRAGRRAARAPACA